MVSLLWEGDFAFSKSYKHRNDPKRNIIRMNIIDIFKYTSSGIFPLDYYTFYIPSRIIEHKCQNGYSYFS